MKILIVDDSALVRSILKHVLVNEKEFFVVGEASNGRQAIELNTKLEPDFIIMDIDMPVMDGLEATRRIIHEKKVPILIFSGESSKNIAYKAIDIGAADVMRKPCIENFNDESFYKSFIKKIHILADKEVSSKPVMPAQESKSKEKKNTCQSIKINTFSEKKFFIKSGESKLIKSTLKKQIYKMLVIGASTGGPSSVKKILHNLPATFPLGIAVVQHMEKGFDRGFAKWLDEASSLDVRLAEKTEMIQKGKVVVAPVDKHLIINGDYLMLYDGPKVLNQKPSVDVLFESAANRFETELIGILLTGMGRDGAKGCVSICSKGGLTLVQDKESSTIFGMPKAAIDLGGASKVLSLEEISKFLVKLVTETQ